MANIEAAIEYLNLQEHPNISEAAKKYNCNRSNLSKRWRGKTGSIQELHEKQSHLSYPQQRILVKYINELSERGTPPTLAMVRQFAGDITKKLPSKAWATRFSRAHLDELKSGYLKGFDLKRKKADSWVEVEAYFKLVSFYISASLNKISNSILVSRLVRRSASTTSSSATNIIWTRKASCKAISMKSKEYFRSSYGNKGI